MKNTYSLLVNSEEKNRSVFEAVVYAAVVACMAFSVFAFAGQSMHLPGTAKAAVRSTEAVAATTAEQPLIASRN